MRKAKFKKQLCVSISSYIHQKIKDLSDLQEVSQAEIVRKLIDESFGQNEHKTSTSKKKERQKCKTKKM